MIDIDTKVANVNRERQRKGKKIMNYVVTATSRESRISRMKPCAVKKGAPRTERRRESTGPRRDSTRKHHSIVD
jgi:hypothetical protein